MVFKVRGPERGYQELQRLGDDEVMASLQAGCDDALAVLFDRYHRLVYSIALRIVRDAGEAEEVSQTVFLDFYRAAAQFDPAKGTTKGWLLQYAYHRALSRKRHLSVRRFYAAEPETPPEPTDPSAFTDRSLEQRDLLQKALASLGDPQRRVIERAIYDGRSMKEIAEHTGETLVNVRHHYYRGLKKLRAFIEQSGVETASHD